MFKKFLQFDLLLIGSVVLLLAVSLLTIYSITLDGSASGEGSNYFYRQLLYVAIGLAVFFIFSSINYDSWMKRCNWLYFIGLALLALVLIFGSSIRGTSGWLVFGGFNFQPVELEKLFIIIFLAGFFSRKKGRLSELVRTVTSIFLVALPLVFVMMQPDLGSALMLIIIWLGMILVSGISFRNFLILFSIGAIIAASSWFLLKDYQQDRLRSFIDPTLDPKGSGYNVIQSIVAVGSGGVFGKGIGHGSQSQLNFLPEKHTDFIFAAIAEELGLVGAGVILLLYAVLFLRFYQIAVKSKDNFGYLFSLGVMILFAGHIAVNIGMNIGMAPVTGVPLPLLSYGGSSLISTLAILGIINNIYRNRRSLQPTIDE